MIQKTCRVLPGECVTQHQFPDDWIFGGASGEHPGSDPRYRPTVYIFFDADLTILDHTTEYTCDEEALDACTKVASCGPKFNPVWVQATRPDGEVIMLPWTYDKATDVLSPTG